MKYANTSTKVGCGLTLVLVNHGTFVHRHRWSFDGCIICYKWGFYIGPAIEKNEKRHYLHVSLRFLPCVASFHCTH